MAADLLLPAIAGTLILGGTDRGRAAARGLWQGVTAPKPKGKGGKRKVSGAKKAPAKKATAPKMRKKGTVSAAVGAWAGRQLRKGAAAAGRQTKRAAVAAHTKAGDRAQARWEQRTDHAKPVSRTPQPDPAGELSPGVTVTPVEPSSKPARPVPAKPNPAPKETAVTVTELETPQSDGQLLSTAHEITRELQKVGEAIQEWGSSLMTLSLASSVTSEVHSAAEEIASAAAHMTAAATQFEAYYEEARTVASKGMHFRGEDAA
jgi:hypothetical protein